jgi:hypothetical protein
MQNMLFRAWGVISTFAVFFGCADPRSEAVTSFENCIFAGAQSLRSGESKVLLCAAEQPFWLVALPGGHQIDSAELVAAGVSKDVADMLRPDEQGRSLLCVVEEFERPDPLPDKFVTARSSCHTTLLMVAQIGQSKSDRHSVRVSVGSDGQIAIDSLAAR